MSFRRFWTFAVGALAGIFVIHIALAQVSTPGSRGPIIQDRMIFYEAALLQLDQRARGFESALKAKDAQIAKLEKEIQASRDRSDGLEKRLISLEITLKKVANGIERGPAPPPNQG